MSNVIISESRAMWINVHLNPFSIWNSYFFQTELPALLVLSLKNKQLWHFLLNPTFHKFSFSVQVYFNLKQRGHNVNMFSPYLLLLLSCRAGFKPTWPISSNRAPRRRGPCATPLTNTNLHFVSKLIVNISRVGPSVFQGVLRDQNGS